MQPFTQGLLKYRLYFYTAISLFFAFNTYSFAQTPTPGVIAPSSQHIIVHTTMSPLTATPATGGNGTYTYQWELSTDNVIYSPISGETSLTFSPSWTIGLNLYFRIKCTSNGISSYSNPSIVYTYATALSPGTLSASNGSTVYYNFPPGWLTGTTPTGGSGSYTYQWLQRMSNGLWLTLSGATSSSYYVGNLTQTTQYRRVVNGGMTATSDITITVIPEIIQGTISPAVQNVNSWVQPGQLTLAAATGGVGGFTYQWELATDNVTFSPISGATGLNYTPGPYNSALYYRRRATSGGANVFSASAVVNVYPQLTAGVIGVNQTISSNTAPATLAGTAPAGGSGGYTYQWQSSANSTTWASISGATAATYSPPVLTSTTYYRRNVTSNGQTLSSGSVKITVSDCQLTSSTPSSNQNYINTISPLKEGVFIVTPSVPPCDVMQMIQYMDGLGRPLQTVQVRASVDGLKDIIQPFAYDQYGRKTVNYLPYASSASIGSYRADALQANQGVDLFYKPATAAQEGVTVGGIVLTSKPYAITGFEASPLNRVFEQGFPGTAWQPGATPDNSSSNNTLRQVYTINDLTSTFSTSNVTTNSGSRIAALYTVSYSGGLPVLNRANNNATYGAGELFVTITRDENWKPAKGCFGTTEEYKDKEGRVVLKRTYNKKGTVAEMLSTYYVYDVPGNLAFVLPPGADPDNAVAISATNLANLCYQYRYDGRNRLVEKRLPGKDWEYTVYNKLDQVVATQDGLQRSDNKWCYIKYDALGRVVQTGTWNNNNVAITRANLQLQVDGITALWENISGTGYSNNAWPISYATWLSDNYYDSYSNVPFPTTHPYSAPAGAGVATNVTGLLLASRTAILNTPGDKLWSVNYYDDKGQVIRTYKQHYLGGATPNVYNYDAITTTYNFTGQPLTVTRTHYKKNSGGTAGVLQLTLLDTYVYDHMGRPTITKNKINSGTEIILSKLEYNQLGQLQTKKLHSENSGTTFLQNINLAYNERGWLKSSTSGLFSETLKYNDGATPQFNGNISETGYVGPNSGSKNFAYSYDDLNRLTVSSVAGGILNESMVYDKAGNITSLARGGQAYTGLTYAYTGNQLTGVTGTGFTARTYDYDVNGNATTAGSNNKKLDYNLLNLPMTLKNSSNVTQMTYYYDATGQKLRTVSTVNGNLEYIGGINYAGTTIASIATAEGRITQNGGVYKYTYDLKDHLGNVRITFDKDPSTNLARLVQEDEYYAFGLRRQLYDNANGNRYLYNGKELQKTEELENQYDYGARFYDPVIARWTSVDPLAEKGRRWSPYNYGFDNPISNTDPDGMWPNPFRLLYDALFRTFTSNTTSSFIKTAASHGVFNSGGIGITKVGRVYENGVLNSLGENKNTKSFSASSFGPKVIPDMVYESRTRTVETTIPQNVDSHLLTFPQASFMDVKFKSNVTLNDPNNPNQMKGMIDVLSNMKGGYVDNNWDPNIKASDWGAAKLTIVTPSNATIDSELIDYATSKRVQLNQRTTEEDSSDPSRIRVAPNFIRLNSIQPKNPAARATLDPPLKGPGQSAEVNW